MLSLRLCFLAALSSVSFAANSAHDTLVFFDNGKCQSYTAANDPITGNKNYENWVNRASALSTSQSDSKWSVFHIDDGRSLGLCKRRYGVIQELSCHQDSYNSFPLAGAKFHGVHDKRGRLRWFRCVDGCTLNVPKLVYDEGYEGDETDPNFIALQKAFQKFEANCPRSGN